VCVCVSMCVCVCVCRYRRSTGVCVTADTVRNTNTVLLSVANVLLMCVTADTLRNTNTLLRTVTVRNGKLGDNMVGVFGQDDVVVPTEQSGLIAHAKPYVDRFDHWPEDSKKNKDLLYGNARKIISQKYTGN